MSDEQLIRPRLSPTPPAELDDEKAAFDATLREGIETYLQGFVSQQGDGALVGLFPGLLQFPDLGRPVWDVFLALAEGTQLPQDVREVIILRTGSFTAASYELYSHEIRARAVGLPDATIRALAAGSRPAELTEQQAIAFEVASVLLDGRPVPDSVYGAAVEAFGLRGAAEIAYLTGTYQLVSAVINMFDVGDPSAS